MYDTSLFPPLSYPRPRLWRDSFFSLDGEWELTFHKGEGTPDELPWRIRVPFPSESSLSGIGRGPDTGEHLFYRKRFLFPRVLKVDAAAMLHIKTKLDGALAAAVKEK